MESQGTRVTTFIKPTKYALEFRSLDGTQNNLTQPDLNSAGTEFARVGPANFADGFLIPAA